jgi:Tetratricopeptide repeat
MLQSVSPRPRRVFLSHTSELRAHYLAEDLRAAGEYERARQLDEGILTRCRVRLGEDDQITLFVARCLALDLRAAGKYEQARALDEDTLTRCRRLLGDGHRDTLTSAHGLAEDLRELGEHEQAHQLDDWIRSQRGF